MSYSAAAEAYELKAQTEFSRALRTETFQFHCGGSTSDDSNTFSVNSGIISRVSTVLAKITNNGHMLESSTRLVKLPETDPDVFALFSRWAFAAPYQDGSSEIFWQTSIALKTFCRGCEKSNPTVALNGQFCSMECYRTRGLKPTVHCHHCRKVVKEDGPCNGCLPKYDFNVRGSVPLASGPTTKNLDLLVYAKLFTFAEMYGVEDMKMKCLYQLYTHLAGIGTDVYNELLPAIFDLIRYVYDNTSAPNKDGSLGVGTALRSLVLDFVVDRQMWFKDSMDFADLLSEGGEFVKDHYFKALQASE